MMKVFEGWFGEWAAWLTFTFVMMMVVEGLGSKGFTNKPIVHFILLSAVVFQRTEKQE
jgi:hypothetical protein